MKKKEKSFGKINIIFFSNANKKRELRNKI